MNKALVLLPLAFVLGGFIGFIGPNEEIQSLRSKVTELESRPAAKSAGGFGTFAKLVNIPDAADSRRRPTPPTPKPAPASSAPTDNAPADVTPTADESSREPAVAPSRPDPEDLRLRLEEAAEFWRTRADMAKAKAIEKLGLDAAGEARFTEAVTAMNDKLRESMQTIAEMLAERESMTPELGVRLMGDLSTTLAESYDALGAVTTAEHRDDVANLQLIDFIDPMVAEPLIAVQDKLDGPLGGRGGVRK